MELAHSAFVSLYVLQALAFVSGFCGIIVHQVQRISSAQECRIQVLADKSLLKALVPTIVSVLNEARDMDIKQPISLSVCNKLFTTILQINFVKEIDVLLVFKVTAIRTNDRVGSWTYLFLEKTTGTQRFLYRGMQFGVAL